MQVTLLINGGQRSAFKPPTLYIQFVSGHIFWIMTDKERKEIELHVAGATVRHSGPFDNVHVVRNAEELDQEFINRFVAPYYMGIPLNGKDKREIEKFGQVRTSFTPDVVQKLLGDFNWRTRQTGTYFAAINDYRQFEENIGCLLLKSEVCYAGATYALALAVFNSALGQKFIGEYLDYYLTTLDLWFDQREVLTALKYLDEVNGTNNYDRYLLTWDKFIINKPNWKREINTDNIREEISGITEIKRYGR